APGLLRHARACPGHLRLPLTHRPKTWMAGTSPAMTTRLSHRSRKTQRLLTSERDLIIHVGALAATPRSGHGRLALARSGGAEVAAIVVADVAVAATAAGAVEHGEGRIEALQHDLGRVALDIVLVGPLAGLQRALEIDLRALLQILLGDLG